jgi:2-[(L-alanin-3-ylcarbamoyl)methyl]-2-hydroxybutanedioate decarboxylase
VTPRAPDRVIAALLSTTSPRCAYVYDRVSLTAVVTAVRAVLPESCTLLYAVKANGHPDVLAALAREVDGFEVASAGELALARIARAGGGRATQIAFSGPAKTDAELAVAVEVHATIHAESLLELRRLAVAAESAGVAARVALRVNRPDADVPGSLQMTGLPTQFGLDPTDVAEAVEVCRSHPALRLVGFHLHAVSNNLDADAHTAFIRQAAAWANATAAEHGIDLTYLNVGGGFGVDYTGERRFDLPTLGRGLADAVRALPAGARVVVEPGRLLAAEAGWYAAEVLDLKRTHGRWFAVIRGGSHHFRLPVSWGYSHPVTVLPVDDWAQPYHRPQVRDVTVDVVGELCSPRDVLAREQYVTHLRVGDVLLFGRTGAYGWEVAHHDFLHHDPPSFHITG